MSASIKRMLAEREALEAKPPRDERLDRMADEQMARIDLAAPYIDEGCPDNEWPPSAKLKIGYFVFATSQDPAAEVGAVLWLHRMLQLARRRFQDGQHPNPFAK